MLTPTDLIEGCIRADAEARSEFVCRFHRNVVSIIVKVAGRNRDNLDLIQDLTQDVYLRIFSDDSKPLRMLRSRNESSVAGLVQAIAYSVACDHFRGQAALKRGGGMHLVSLDAPEAPQISKPGHADEILRSILFSEIDRALVRLVGDSARSEQRTVFWLYFRHGLSARDIADSGVGNLNPKGVESLLSRLTKRVRERLGVDVGEPLAEGKLPSIPSEDSGR